MGNNAAVPTKIYLGYDPFNIRQLEKLDNIIANLTQTLNHLNAVAGHLPPDANETTRKLANLTVQRESLMKRRSNVLDKLAQDENNMQSSRVLVQGKVYPGVEISIGRAFMLVERVYENSLFRLCHNDIVVEPLPERKIVKNG